MTQATTHNTTTPRRAHPAVVRAALRSHDTAVSSYPRRRVSSLNKHWISACAGMTADANGNTHRFDYDKLDRMVKETRPLGQRISYAYDAVGNLTQVTDPLGQVKKYTYDAANRRIKEDHYPSTGSGQAPVAAVKTISYSYNTLDRLTGYTDGTTTGTYTYDTKQLRQIGESITYASTSTAQAGFTLASSTAYNALGQKASQTYPDGATYTYSYDANNQLSIVDLPQGSGSITLNNYLWSVPSQITLPGGTVRTLQYDGLLRLKTLAVKDPGQSQVMSYQYGYDLTGNIVSKATEQSTTNYNYDTLDHLTGATYTNSSQTNETYIYDPLANRVTDSKTAAANWVYNANNQLIQAGSIRYTYDENGNTLSQTDANNPANTRSYVYDTDNRLIEVHDASNAIVATYRYDPFGRRISKTLNNGSQSNTTYYFYSAEGLIAEADSNGQLTKSYGYAPGSTFSTNPLWMKVPASGTQTAATYYTYQNDHLGTPMKLLNQSGVTVWSATYDAFGRATVDSASTVSNNLRYPGQYEDAESGLHYNWNRYYDPQIGRYVTSDPIGLWGGINTYLYGDANPVSKIDPLGLATFMCTKPLHALGGNGAKSGADIWGNPLYHQYLCVSDGKGGHICGGQDQRGTKWYDPLNGPGKPSNDSYDKNTCEQEEPDNNCIEKCLLTKFNGPRPRYGIPFGTDCQEWSDDALKQCQKQCKKK